MELDRVPGHRPSSLTARPLTERLHRACKRLKLKHIRTRPYTPKTNGKAERFIQTALREWAYARPTPPPASEPNSSSPGSTPIIGTGLTEAQKGQSANQPPRTLRGQPVEAPHLVVATVNSQRDTLMFVNVQILVGKRRYSITNRLSSVEPTKPR